MKKIVFTVQIFGLVAAFPMYLITELNQVKANSALPETPAVVIETQAIPVSMVLPDTAFVFERPYMAFKKPNNAVVKAIN